MIPVRKKNLVNILTDVPSSPFLLESNCKQGEGGWNTGPKSSNNCAWDDFECTTDPDEGAFIALIIAELRTQGATGNVYAIGNSNGAALAHRLASNAGDDLPIKGIVTKVTQLLASPPRSGPGVLNHNQPPTTGPKVSVLNIMGLDDGLIPYHGGSSSVFGGDANFQLMDSIDSMVTWAGYNGCSADPTVEVVDYDTDLEWNTATFYSYPCPEGTVVEHYAVGGAGHSFAKSAALDGVSIDYDLAYDFIFRVEGGAPSGPPPPAPSPPNATPSPTIGNPSECEDDPSWAGKHNPDHDCAYVSANTEVRCGWESSDGTRAFDACALSCGKCGDVTTTSSSGFSTPDATTTAETTTVPETTTDYTTTSEATTVPETTTGIPGCADDPSWAGKFNPDHDCAYVSANPEVRCDWESSDGTKAYDACALSCVTCEEFTTTGAPGTTTVAETTPAATTTPEATTTSEATTVPETTTDVPACVDDPSWRGKFDDSHDCAYVSAAPQFRCNWESSDGTRASEACEEACDCTSRR